VVTFCTYRRIAANGETVGYVTKYSGLMKDGAFLIGVRNNHTRPNLV